MKQYKKTAVFTLILLLFTISALGESAPASQFGIHAWPYRNADSPCLSTQQPSSATPAPQPTAQPEATASPIVTPIPTAQPTAVPAPTDSGNLGDYTTVSVSAQEYSAWNLLNNDRIANNLSSLPLDSELCRIARIKSCDMKTNGYFAHESPTYGNATAMLQYFGYAFQSAGENIAHHATIEKAQAAFMSSSGHRTNILGSQWTRVGIGVCYDDQGYVYVTQIFAR